MALNRDVQTNEERRMGSKFGIRHLQAILIFLGFAMAYCIRTSMSVAIIALTDTTRESEGIQIFHWDKKVQDYILGSFFNGYVLMQIPGGQLAYRFGGNILLTLSLFLNGLLSLVTPTIIQYVDWKGAFACRVLQGATQGVMLPSMHTLIGKWAPVHERNRYGLFVYSGFSLGTIVGLYGSGKLATTSFGWPIIFYVVGLASLSISLLIYTFGAESPAKHKRISNEEKDMIQKSLHQTEKRKKRRMPWKKILTSVPFAALQIAHIGSAWGFLLMLTETPSYFKMVFNFSVENSAAISSLPQLISWAVSISTSFIADYLINKNVFDLTKIRKIFNTLGSWGAAAALLSLGFVSLDQINVAVFLVVMVSAMDAFGGVGFMLNHIDLSPNYAGVLISITNCVAIGVCSLSPIMVGHILTDTSDMSQWKLIFITAGAFYFFGNLIFIIFGTAERQPWDSDSVENEDEAARQIPLMEKDQSTTSNRNTDMNPA